MIGFIGDVMVFSFYVIKNLVIGEGGMLMIDDEEFVDNIWVLSFYGMSKVVWNCYFLNGSWYYEVELFGYKMNMFDLQVVFGFYQLKWLDDMQEWREEFVGCY